MVGGGTWERDTEPVREREEGLGVELRRHRLVGSPDFWGMGLWELGEGAGVG
jgi:hypothetical protein